MSPEQRIEIQRRLVMGESVADLAREFNVEVAWIRNTFTAAVNAIKDVAHQMVDVNEKLSSLAMIDQLQTVQLADKLKSISLHMASAAEFGAATANRLSGIAHKKTELINEVENMQNGDNFQALKDIAALTRLANDAAQIPMGLLSANKDRIKKLDEADENPMITSVEVRIVDAS